MAARRGADGRRSGRRRGLRLHGRGRYRATAQLIVSPVSASDPTYLGLGVLRDTGGKRTAAASAAVLLRSAQVADAVRTELGLTRSRDSLLSALHAHAVGSSDIVDVTVEDTSAVRAAQLANAFANAVVSQRTASFQSQLATAIRRAEQQLLALPPNQRTIGAGALLQQRLTVLRSSRAARSDHPAFRAGGGADRRDRTATAASGRDRRRRRLRHRAARGRVPCAAAAASP